MSFEKFVWNDLSTYDMATAKQDYGALLGWSFDGDGSYDFAGLNGAQCAAIFPMPQRFIEIKMPSFWMSYVRVRDIDQTVEAARKHEGAIIEVEPQSFNEDARVALIRDPSGAGFTVYEGPEIRQATGTAGAVELRYHHVPDIGLIDNFYQDLFGWTFQETGADPWRVFDVRHKDGTLVARAEEVPEQVRGTFRYWMPCFAVASKAQTLARLAEMDGQVFTEFEDGRALVADRQGAHFMIRPLAQVGQVAPAPKQRGGRPSVPLAWKAMLGLGCIWLAVALDFQPFWGVLFLLWTWLAIKSGRADFIEPVSRTTAPVLYWALIGTWVLLSVWLILAPFIDQG